MLVIDGVKFQGKKPKLTHMLESRARGTPMVEGTYIQFAVQTQ